MGRTDSYGNLAHTTGSATARQEFANTIKKEILSNAIQHPATLLPLTTGILALIYQQFFSQRFGAPGLSLLVFFASGILATASFVWHYIIRFPKTFAQKAKELQDQQEQARRASEQAELQQLRETVYQGLSKINATRGLKALQELDHEYHQLISALEQEPDNVYLSMSEIRELAEKTYQRGLSVLADAMELGSIIRSTDARKLEAEIRQLEREIALLTRKPNRQDQLEIKRATLKSHQERLELIDRQQVQIEKLLYQCDRCEASLQKTRIEFANLKAQSFSTDVSAVTETLQHTIDQAKAVQTELKNLGY